MDDIDIVRLSVPGTLLYRDVVLRVVSSFCRLARADASPSKQEASRSSPTEFDDKVVSAIGEAFNNVAIHGYRGRRPETVLLELELIRDGIRVRLTDTGAAFDPSGTPARLLASLPESHMGLYIIRACMDTVTYEPGSPPSLPNVLTLTKRFSSASLEVAEGQ